MGKGIKNVLGITYYWPAGRVTSHCTHHKYTTDTPARAVISVTVCAGL